MLSEVGNALGNTSTRGPCKVLPLAFSPSFILGSVNALKEGRGILLFVFLCKCLVTIASKEQSEPNTLSARY